MANKDIFAPPSEDELFEAPQSKQLAAPSDEELGVKPDKPLTAALAGYGQGATLGFSDELAGALMGGAETALEPALPEQSKLQQLIENYKAYRDIARKTGKELEESNPKSYMAGEFGGALTSPANALIPGSTLGKGASTGAKILESAKGGAALGATAGLGGSEGKTLEEDISATGQGAGLGLAAGAAIPLVAGTGNALREAITDTKMAKALGKAYKYGRAGEDVVSGKATRPLEEAITGEAGNVTGELRDEALKLASGQKNIIKGDTRQFNLNKLSSEIDKKLSALENGPPGSEADIQKLKAMKEWIDQKPGFTLEDVDQLKKQFQGMADVNPDYTDRMSTKAGEAAASDLKNLISKSVNEASPELADQNKLIQNFNNQLESSGIKNLRADDMDAADLRKTQEYLTNLITKSEKEGISPQNARERIEALKSAVEQTNPELANKIGSTFSDLSEKYKLNQYATKETPLLGINVVPLKQGTLRAAQETGKIMSDITTGLANKTPEFFKSLGGKLSSSSSDGAQKLAPIIDQMAGRDLNGRKALIFTVMQNPVYRKIILDNAPELVGEKNGE